MPRKASLKTIAEKVGVSIASVSYVLSKGADSGISQEVSDRIKKAAKELNYQPNQIAKSLKSGKTNTIGLIVADISNPFFAHIARVVEDEAAKLDYTVIFGSSDEKAAKSKELIKVLGNRQVDGFIIAPTENSQEQIQNLLDQKMPLVLLDRYFPELPASYVALDNYSSANAAVQSLIDSGYKKIGVVAYSHTLFHVRERIRGYREACINNGLKIDEDWVRTVDYDTLKSSMSQHIDAAIAGADPVDALFFTTNTLAINGIRALDKMDVKIPRDLGVVVFDQSEVFEFFYCPLSYVKQPIEEMAKRSVQILLGQINAKTAKMEHINLEANLVLQESSRKRSLSTKD